MAKIAARSLLFAQIFAVLGLLVLGLTAPIPSAHAQGVSAPDTQYVLVITYSTVSGFGPTNVNITWADSNSCGIFSGFGPGATWEYGSTAGVTPCANSLPGGTISVAITSGGTVLASCSENQGAATWGSFTTTSGVSAPGCSSAGTGVIITEFSAQAYNAAGDPIAAPSGNDDWIIAVVVVILILLILFFLWWRRRKATVAPGQSVQAAPGVTASPIPTAGASYCGHCGHVLDPGAKFCRSCGAPVT